jgi:hypothetical protein
MRMTKSINERQRIARSKKGKHMDNWDKAAQILASDSGEFVMRMALISCLRVLLWTRLSAWR